jgi:hypothetical protein
MRRVLVVPCRDQLYFPGPQRFSTFRGGSGNGGSKGPAVVSTGWSWDKSRIAVLARRLVKARSGPREGAAPDGGHSRRCSPARALSGGIIAEPVYRTCRRSTKCQPRSPSPPRRLTQCPAPDYRLTPKRCPPPAGRKRPRLPRFRAQARLGDKADAGARIRSRLHSPPPTTQR